MSQLTLSYQEITNVANRDYMRENFKRAPRDSYYTPLNKLKEREGYNKRVVYEEIRELADSIFAHGLQEPFHLNVLADGNIYIVRGHRRWRAYLLLVEEGKFAADVLVEFYPVKSNVSEMAMLLDQHISNNLQKKMKPIERANLAFELKHNFGTTLSHEQIAEKMCISRQHVDNLIKIASCDDAMKNEMLMADMGITECMNFISSKKKLDKQTNDAEIEGNKTSAAKTPLPHDPNAEELAELKEMEKQVANNDEEDDFPFVEETAEQEAVREQAEAEKAMEQLLLVADEVNVKKLSKHKDRKLAADAKILWQEDFVDEDNGEVIIINREKIVYKKNTILDDEIIANIKNEGVETVFLFKPGCEPVAPSVITEPVATKEKDRYDSGRPEIKAIQKAIQLVDKIEAIITKLDVPEDVKKDMSYNSYWAIKNMEEAREWIHLNKKR